MRRMQFWFEFASTYTHVAALRVEAEAGRRGVTVEWRPFLLGPLFQRQGWSDSPFNLNPVRGRYMWRDVERQCARYGVPFRRPSEFPRRSLLAARVACLAIGQDWIAPFALRVFRANFVEDRDIADPVVLGAILESLDRPAAATLAAAGAPEIKERLRRETEAAWDLGIFGAPSFVVDGELFWGNDRLEDALDWRAAPGARS